MKKLLTTGNYSIQMYIGEKRSGKTLTMIKETHDDIQEHPDITVFSNLKLNKTDFPTYQPLTHSDLTNYYKKEQEMQNCIFLIDEGHIFLDSRKFMRKGNQQIGYFFGQMGKRGNVLRLTTHFPGLVDYRARLYCERTVYVEKGLLTGNKWKPILDYNRILTPEENNRLWIKATPTIRKLLNYEFIDIKQPTLWIHAEDYFTMYDTRELIYIIEEEKENGNED